ncbi:hypothetical protein PISL3812_09229 [Talaromyces islandicus]|uniref:Uncharacterized protein n=1 Tax=Talaromyces islandicus TaxID=28573 RepID=A0A0U1M954_TALIS|nr:hypothetical protein PISL3812_09229 [Talaromyces islandicus]
MSKAPIPTNSNQARKATRRNATPGSSNRALSSSSSSSRRSLSSNKSNTTNATTIPDVEIREPGEESRPLQSLPSNAFGNTPINFHLHAYDESWRTFDIQHYSGGFRLIKSRELDTQNSIDQSLDAVQDSGRPVEQAEPKPDKSSGGLDRRIKDLEKEIDHLKEKKGLMKEIDGLRKERDDFRKERDELKSEIGGMRATQLEKLRARDKKVEEARNAKETAEREQARITAQNLKLRNGTDAQISNLHELLNLEGKADIQGTTEDEEDILRIQRLYAVVTKIRDEYENQKQKLNAKNVEIDGYKKQVTKLMNDITSARDQATATEAENVTLGTQVQDLQNLNSNLRQENQTLNRRVQDLQNLINNLRQENQTLNTQTQDLQDLNNNLRQENQTTNTRVQDLQNLNNNLRQENQTLNRRVQDVENLHNNLQQENQTLQDQLEEQNTTLERQRRQTRRVLILSALQQFRKNVLTRKYNRLQQQHNDISQERDDMQQQNETLPLQVDCIKNPDGQGIDYFVYQMRTGIEPVDTTQASSTQEIVKLDETPSTVENLPLPVQYLKDRARKSTGPYSRTKTNRLLRTVRNGEGTFVE